MAANENEATAPPASNKSLLGRLIIAAFMGGIVLTECALAYVFIPSADDLVQRAEENAKEEMKKDSDEAVAAKDTKPVVEIELGRFGVTAHQPQSSTTLRVDFTLVGTVLEGEENDFQDLLARNQHRFRDMVIVEIRNSEVADLTDPGLGLIKRRILEKSNALFGRPILRSVFFSDYTYLDQ